ncbi:MAG TPA: hypothetical protein VG225_07060 [Terracidiphilus sp.]|jgi:hypothetical protein|nr:hypothetical protein [Terracidiphilus sp.]
MLRALASTCVVAGCMLVVSAPSSAQEIIHALTGTVSAIDNAGKTITVFQDSGSKGVFQDMSNPKTHISFDKKIAAETTAATVFDKQGAYVIVFYFGNGDDNRTVVALKSLGAGPFSSTDGTVTNFDSRTHSISVADKSGKVETFRIGDQTVAESDMGAVEGIRFHAQKGDQVRVVSSNVGGNPTALFVRDL